MTVVALTSTRGAPGVTTTALALALTWPRPVLLVEADVSGSSSIKAGHFRGGIGSYPNIVDLVLARRNGAFTVDAVREACVELPLDPSRLVLPGLVNSHQVSTLTADFWGDLAAVLAAMSRHGFDVIIDAGRLGMRHGPDPLVERADLLAVVTRTRLDDVVSVRAHAAQIRGDVDVAVNRVGVLLVGEGQPYAAKEAGRAIGLPVWASIAWDPVNADYLSGGQEITSRARFDRSPLLRSARSAVVELERLDRQRRQVLGLPDGRLPERRP